MSTPLAFLSSALGLSEGGVVAVLLGLVFCSMALAVALLLRQTYREQVVVKPSRIEDRIGFDK